MMDDAEAEGARRERGVTALTHQVGVVVERGQLCSGPLAERDGVVPGVEAVRVDVQTFAAVSDPRRVTG